MTFRTLLLAATLLTATATHAAAESARDALAIPVLRQSVTVTGDIVRIGDMIDNAGPAAEIAIYRAPDLGTTGSLPTAQVLTTLRAHQVIGVDTRDIKEVAVTRLARTVATKEIEQAVTAALEHRNGLGDAANWHSPSTATCRTCGWMPPIPARCSRSRRGPSRAAGAST
jgi:flagella basal body P-ring formation protein FlgA